MKTQHALMIAAIEACEAVDVELLVFKTLENGRLELWYMDNGVTHWINTEHDKPYKLKRSLGFYIEDQRREDA